MIIVSSPYERLDRLDRLIGIGKPMEDGLRPVGPAPLREDRFAMTMDE